MNQIPTSTETFTIGQFARKAAVSVETLRFYQRKGLLRLPEKPYGGIRRYGDEDIKRVRFIKKAQRLGFSLEEIGQLLKLQDGTHCAEAQKIAQHKLAFIEQKIADLQSLKAILVSYVQACENSTGDKACPLISGLLAEE